MFLQVLVCLVYFISTVGEAVAQAQNILHVKNLSSVILLKPAQLLSKKVICSNSDPKFSLRKENPFATQVY